MPARRLVVLVARLGLVTAIVAGCAEAAPVTLPPAAPPVDCRGVPAETCQQTVNDARINANPGEFLVQVRVVCSTATCTVANGEAQVDILYTNGRHDSYSTGWASAVDPAQPAGSEAVPAPLPVEPVCVGVPPGPCHDQAEIIDPDGMEGQDTDNVVSVVVRCTIATCTEVRGDGDTTVNFRDGTKTVADWSYEGASAS